jgi:glutaredoxin
LDYADRAIYYDVKTDKAKLAEMLVLAKGDRSVPVIIEGDSVTVGYGGT